MATSRTVTVNIVGDSSGFHRALGTAGAAADTTGHRISSAFMTSFSAISMASGGAIGPLQEVMDAASVGMEGLSKHGKSAGETVGAVGLAAAGAGAALTVFGSKDQAAQQQLAQAITNTGGSYADYKSKIEDVVKSQAKYGNTSSQVMNGLQQLTSATKDPQKALDMMGEAANLAAAKHESLGTAVSQMTQIIAGKGTRVLMSLGIQHVAVANTAKGLASATKGVETAQTAVSAAQQKLTDLEAVDHAKKSLTIGDQIALRNAHTAVTTASDKLSAAQVALGHAQDGAKNSGGAVASMLKSVAEATNGQAVAASDTFTGKLKGLRAEIENNVATLGQKYGPALTAAGVGVTALGTGMNIVSEITKHLKGAEELATVATEAGSAAKGIETVATASEAAADTALIPVEGLALGPILLIIGAIALLGVGIYELVSHWKAVWGAVKDVIQDAHRVITGVVDGIVGFVKGHWELLLAILTGPFGLATLFIKDHFEQIMSFITGMPARITSIASGMWHGITDGFRTAINAVIDLWDRLHLTLPAVHLPFGLGSFGGETFTVPQIPHLGDGGIVMSPTLLIAGEKGGEAITPLSALPGLAGGSSLSGGHSHDIYLDGRLVGAATAQHVRSTLLQTTARNAPRVGLG